MEGGSRVLNIGVIRIGRSLLVVTLVTFAATVLLRLTPGSVSNVILGDGATPEAVEALDKKLGLDGSVLSQYFAWMGSALQGDLGSSPLNGQSVTAAIGERLPVTLQLAVMGLSLALLISVALAVIAAARPGGGPDRVISAVTMAFLSIPAFIAGPVLIYFLALQLRMFPALGWVRIEEDLLSNLHHALLPAVAIALAEIAAFQRLLRSDLIETLGEDYIAAARVKGLSKRYVMFRHALRPSSFSLMTVAGINLGRLIGGTVIVETLFGLPGLGQLVAVSITGRDVVMVQGVVVFIAVVYVGVNTLVDVGYGLLDPRVRKAARA
jgi:peptide/nickel transport system permease protein